MPPKSQLWPVWGALLGSLFIYAALPHLIPPRPVPPPLPMSELVGAFAIAALVIGMATLAIRHFLLLGPARAGTLDPRSKAGNQRVWTLSLITWVLAESIGILGLVLFLLYRVHGLFYPFLGAAIALLLIHAPRRLPAPLTHRTG